MRSVERLGLVPPKMQPPDSAGSRARERLWQHHNEGKPFHFPDHWNEPDVRGLLHGIHGFACAFCGRELIDWQVEHFRPKAEVAGETDHTGYFWLAYEVSNYLASCGTCNGAIKRNHFPLAVGSVRATAEAPDLTLETPLLCASGLDPLDDWLRVEWSEPLCPVGVNENLHSAVADRAKHFRDFFQLNSSPHALIPRIKLRDRVRKILDGAQPEEATRLASRYAPHSLVAAQMLAAEAPELLPGEKEEMGYLVEELEFRLGIAERALLAKPAKPERVKREYFQALFALGALWRTKEERMKELISASRQAAVIPFAMQYQDA